MENGQRILGITHKGIHNFTIGKRVRPLDCTNPLNEMLTNSDALYVADIDPRTQTVYLVGGGIE